MSSRRVLVAISPLVFIILLWSACGATQYTDPFAYCAAVGTVDAPDARYTGPKTPEAIVRGLMKAMDLPADAPSEPLARLTTWRCMSGKVYACNFGANIPCQEKADTSRAPSAAMNDFCKANPASDFIPVAVTGRATVYAWRCANGAPAIEKELTKPDTQGFLTMFWYEVSK
jgi:hypothetical protein